MYVYMYVCMYVCIYNIQKYLYEKFDLKKYAKSCAKSKIIMDNSLAGSGFTPSSTGFIPVSF